MINASPLVNSVDVSFNKPVGYADDYRVYLVQTARPDVIVAVSPTKIVLDIIQNE